MRKLLEYCAEHNRKRVILYTRFTNKQSELVTTASLFAQFPQVRMLSHITSRQNKDVFAWFQVESDDLRIIANVGICKEGIDLPCCDTVVFADDKKSGINIMQSVGRGIRTVSSRPDKQCHVVCMIPWNDDVQTISSNDYIGVYDEQSASEDASDSDTISVSSSGDSQPQNLETKYFDRIMHILKGLRSYDSRVEDLLYSKPSTLQLNILLPVYVVNREQRYIKILKLLQQNTLGSEYQAVQNANSVKVWYYSHNNKFPSTISTDSEEKRLGQWLSQMRKSNKGRGDRVLYVPVKDILNSFGALQGQDPEQNAIQNANSLKSWYQSHNNKFPSRTSTDSEEKRLGQWLNNMRKSNKGTTRNGQKLYAQMKDILDSIGALESQRRSRINQ